MGRVESFSYKSTVVESVVDSLGMGMGYTWVLCAISIVRELLGAGVIFGMKVIPDGYTIGFFSQSPGGFFVFGLLISASFAVNRAIERKGAAK